MQQCSSKTMCMSSFADLVIQWRFLWSNISNEYYQLPFKASKAKLSKLQVIQDCQSVIIIIHAVKMNLCHWITFPCCQSLCSKLLQICAFMYLFACPPSPLTGNSWKILECISEAFTVLQMMSEHFLSSLHNSIFFFHYNIYHPYFHLSQFHSLSAYWPIKGLLIAHFFFFIDLPLGEGRRFVFFLSPPSFPCNIFSLLFSICELQPSVWISGRSNHIAVALHSSSHAGVSKSGYCSHLPSCPNLELEMGWIILGGQ